MKVPLTVNDFIRPRRAALPATASASSTSPTNRAESWGSLTYARGGRTGPGDGRRARRAGHRRRRAGRHGQPQLGPPDHRPVRRVRARAGSSCRSTSGSSPRRSATSSSTPAPACCSSTPSSTTRSPSVDVRAPARDRRRRRRALLRFGVEPRAVGRRRGRHGDDQLHVRHDGPAEGRAAHPPQHLAQRHDVRLAPRRQRPRRVPAHAAAVPLQRLGDALRGHRDGRPAHRPAQGRRRRDPAPGRASTASR